MTNVENPFAGQGPVLLDIGGDIGALVVEMPADTDGLEVEIRPIGTTAARTTTQETGHDHGHTHASSDSPDERQGHGPASHPHVGVVARPGATGPRHTLVYPDLREGGYELVPIPGDRVALTVHVAGGEVTHAVWPA
jgi:hypothetical protein